VVHDEAVTFFFYIQTGKFLPFLAHWEGNNHILNSALSTLFYNLFGLSLLSLRLANLLSFPLLCLFLMKTGKLISHPVIRWSFYISLLMAHGFLEFFSLSRGYGLSMAFLMPAIYYLIRFCSRFSFRDSLLATAWIIPATLTNLTLLITYTVFFVIICFSVFFTDEKSSFKKKIRNVLLVFLLWAPPLIFFIAYSLALQQRNQLLLGGSRGFWIDSVETLVSMLFNSGHWLILMIIILTGVFSLYMSFLTVRYRKDRIPVSLIFISLLTGNIAGIFLLHWFFGIYFPESRGILFFYVFITGAFCFATQVTLQRFRRKAWLLVLLPLIFIPVHFFTRFNFSHSTAYYEGPITPDFYQAVSTSQSADGFPPTVGGRRLRHLCWVFTDYLNGGRQNPVYWQDFPGQLTDFQIADREDLGYFTKNYTVIDSFLPAERYLLKRNRSVEKTLIIGKRGVSSGKPVHSEYLVFFKMPADTLIGHSLFVEVEAEIVSREEPLTIWMAAEARDSANQSLRYDYIPLNWIRPAWNGSDSLFRKCFLLHDLPAGTKSFRVYIWNRDSLRFRMDRGVVRVFDIPPG
jgi:hypothetical protein